MVKKEDDQEDSTKEEEGKANADKEHDELPDNDDWWLFIMMIVSLPVHHPPVPCIQNPDILPPGQQNRVSQRSIIWRKTFSSKGHETFFLLSLHSTLLTSVCLMYYVA